MPLFFRIQADRDFGVDLMHNRFEQTLLAAKMMVKRTPRHAGIGADRIHRAGRIAFAGKSASGGGQQLGCRLRAHFATAAAGGQVTH